MPFNSEDRELGVGLALSGGGYRAVLFHCGALLRLNEAAALGNLKRISSVSGGSIVAGVLAVKWAKLVIRDGRITNLGAEVIAPLQQFCSHTLDVGAVISGVLNPFKSIGDELIDAYRSRLGLDVPLSSLSDDGPRFVFNSTNYATGVSFRFSKPYCGDYRIGLMRDSGFDVATAVAASSAFPPVFSPITLDVDPDKFTEVPGADLYAHKDFRRRLLLADGGVYDNMGLETVWGRYQTVLVSDGGKPFEIDSKPSGSLAQLARVADIGLNQTLALRKRVLIEHFRDAANNHGAYWGINTAIGDYGLADALPVSAGTAARLSAMRTRLNAFSESEQHDLVNWGYAVCDAALRARAPELVPANTPPPAWPFSDRRLT